MTSACSVHIRYYQHLDARKDVDNILKAILDGLDGKAGPGKKMPTTVIFDDREVEHVVSRRTKIDYTTRLDGRRLRPKEIKAANEALAGQAAVYVAVLDAPDHGKSVSR